MNRRRRMRRPGVRRGGLWTAVVLGALMFSPLYAQDDVNLDEFEDVSPEVEEVSPGDQEAPRRMQDMRPSQPPDSQDAGPRFEDLDADQEVEELEVPEAGTTEADASGRQGGSSRDTGAGNGNGNGGSAPAGDPAPPPLPEANVSPAPAQGPGAEPRPLVSPDVEPRRGAQSTSPTGVRTQTQLPSQNLSFDGEFEDQIRELNRQISLLKEKVIEAKSRLLSYSQKVAQGFASGTQLFATVVNNLKPKDFQIESVTFYLDGHQVFSREFEPGEKLDSLPAYKGSVLPGRHRIDVEVVLAGDTGMFDTGYSARMELETGEYFAANEGKIVELDVVLFDRGGRFKNIESRPGVKFEIVERDVF